MSSYGVRVLYADPPWPSKDTTRAKTGGVQLGTATHYPTMSIAELCDMQLPPINEDAWLFMWRLGGMQHEALQVAFHWGFRVCSEVVWVKTTKHGKRWFGPGTVVRGEHEVCLIGKRGRISPNNRSVRSVITAPCLGHSRKPDEMYELIEQISSGPYCELFARRVRDGWQQHGNQLEAE